MARFEKEFRHLCRHIDSLSAGQSRVAVDNIFDPSKSSSDQLSATAPCQSNVSSHSSSFFLEISPHDGPYAHASFVFHVAVSKDSVYPEEAPLVSCLTRIYHPNIDTQYHNHYNNVCVSTLSDWNDGMSCSLDVLVQSLLFLFYSPNLDDPLTSDVSRDEAEFCANVRISIDGGSIPDFERMPFERNYGYQRYLIEQEQQQLTTHAQPNGAGSHTSTQEPTEKTTITEDGHQPMSNSLGSTIACSIQFLKEMLLLS